MDKPTNKQIRTWGEKISASDQGAFDSLFRSLYPRLIHFARNYNRNEAVARDIVQEAFVVLWEKRDGIDPDRSLQAYLYRIVRNKSLNHMRDHAEESIWAMDRPLEAPTDHEKQEETEQLVDLLNQWIKKLPKRQREAFELSRFEGLDHDEIAGVMNISPNTVNNHIVSALHTLRGWCDEYKTEQVND